MPEREASKSSLKHSTTAGSSRSYVWTKLSGGFAPKIPQPEGRAACHVLLRARRQVQRDLLVIGGDAPGTEHRFPRQPGAQTLGHAVDEQLGDREFTVIPPGEGFVFLPQMLRHLADRRATQHACAARITERRANISTPRRSSSAMRRARPARTRDANGSARSATCWTPYSMGLSAVASRPRR